MEYANEEADRRVIDADVRENAASMAMWGDAGEAGGVEAKQDGGCMFGGCNGAISK